jgi:Pyridine nucleotide-disulphide oxidoreductase
LIAKLESLKISVMLNERVERDGDGGQSIVPGAATLRLASGKTLQTDLQFWMAGAGRPHSEFATAALSGAIDTASGRIRVNEFGQVLGSTNVFAVGDVAQLPVPEQNLGYFAGLQGQVCNCSQLLLLLLLLWRSLIVHSFHSQAAAGNIIRATKGSSLKVYKPHTSSMLMLPLGPQDGIAQTPMGVLGKGMVTAIKSKNLFTNQNWKALGLTPPTIV